METESSEATTSSNATNNTCSGVLFEHKTPLASEDSETKRKFICGVVEGFYGRPWTTEQRKDLFRKLKKWGMDSYVYAPKDDYKHRAFWRELYTVEEAEFLTSLIADAKENGVTFYYALSPGLDMTYSNQKEIQILKRKLDQVSNFGCSAFALLFDDIEAELSKADKEVFQTFANAQVSVTNEIFMHLGNPHFLFCPTQYCSTRANPTVQDSEYLTTLGSKLIKSIDIMWTGKQVITKTITLESIQEISEILRRPPVIWDNLHANDYDQKRVFLGPYSGRSPELIPYLRGVMTNPNCEFHANTIAIYTLAYWSHCHLDSKLNNSAILSDIKLETENEDDLCDVADDEQLDNNTHGYSKIYHPKMALKNAIVEWLPEFAIEKEAWGPITKPQPAVIMPIIPIIPSINTCMSLTTTTATSTTVKTVTVPEVNTTQLQALASAFVTSTATISCGNPLTNPVMNSLISPTKVVTNDDIMNPIPPAIVSNIELPKKIPISIMPGPIMHHPNLVMDNEITASSTVSQLNVANNAIEIAVEAIETNDYDQKKDNNHQQQQLRCSLKEPTIENGKCQPCEVEVEEEQQNIRDEDDVIIRNDSSPVSTIDAVPLDSCVSTNEPMECSSSLASHTASPKNDDDRKIVSEDVIMTEAMSTHEQNHSMQLESTAPSSPLSMNADEIKELDIDEMNSVVNCTPSKINADDLLLLCDLFYLPFEHGGRAMKLLNEFNWLKSNASVLLCRDQHIKHVTSSSTNNDGSNTMKRETANNSHQSDVKPEVAEWHHRAEHFFTLCSSVYELLRKVANCANKEICHDLFSYLWDIAGALTLLEAFVKWLSLGRFPPNIYIMTQGSYTWFSKGWKEAFMSGDQEPWVFRGGLIADLQRLMPVDSGNDLFIYKLPELPTTECYFLRPYIDDDEAQLKAICTAMTLEGCVDKNGIVASQSKLAINNCETNQKINIVLSESVKELLADIGIVPFLNICPQLCMVAHNANNEIVGYVAAAMNLITFGREFNICCLPDLRLKYPNTLLEPGVAIDFTTPPDETINHRLIGLIGELHNTEYQSPVEVSSLYPAALVTAMLHTSMDHVGICKRLLTVVLATLRSNGCFGAHARINIRDIHIQQYYNQVGFIEVHRDETMGCVFMGRRF